MKAKLMQEIRTTMVLKKAAAVAKRDGMNRREAVTVIRSYARKHGVKFSNREIRNIVGYIYGDQEKASTTG